MRAGPLRLGQPLILPRRADDAVVGHGVVVGIVEVLLPLVGALQLRFER